MQRKGFFSRKKTSVINEVIGCYLHVRPKLMPSLVHVGGLEASLVGVVAGTAVAVVITTAFIVTVVISIVLRSASQLTLFANLLLQVSK